MHTAHTHSHTSDILKYIAYTPDPAINGMVAFAPQSQMAKWRINCPWFECGKTRYLRALCCARCLCAFWLMCGSAARAHDFKHYFMHFIQSQLRRPALNERRVCHRKAAPRFYMFWILEFNGHVCVRNLPRCEMAHNLWWSVCASRTGRVRIRQG